MVTQRLRTNTVCVVSTMLRVVRHINDATRRVIHQRCYAQCETSKTEGTRLLLGPHKTFHCYRSGRVTWCFIIHGRQVAAPTVRPADFQHYKLSIDFTDVMSCARHTIATYDSPPRQRFYCVVYVCKYNNWLVAWMVLFKYQYLVSCFKNQNWCRILFMYRTMFLSTDRIQRVFALRD